MSDLTIEQLVERGLSSDGRANWIAQRVAQLADDLRGLVASGASAAEARERARERRRLERGAPQVSTLAIDDAGLYLCPQCPFKHRSPQGVGAHRRYIHKGDTA